MKALIFTYIFLFAGLVAAYAHNPKTKLQQQPVAKNCIKQPQIIKKNSTEKAKPIVVKQANKTTDYKSGTNVIHNFSVLNFINFFYSKDTLDNLHVM
jgi:hypothetical protein